MIFLSVKNFQGENVPLVLDDHIYCGKHVYFVIQSRACYYIADR